MQILIPWDQSLLQRKMKSKLQTWIPGGLLGVGLLGFIDATYLTIKHYTQGEITCSITNGCDVVTSSIYSEIFGIPVALLGALFYLTMVVAMIAYLDRKNEKILRLASCFTIAGLLASIYFVSLPAFVLHAWCQYCIGSAITSTTLFVFGMIYLYHQRKA